ncbi:MAG TPA: neutral/alkaline non-lysosomal ceramidase N-terminal domain-containing protein [Anaeromyxobacteraceae bacterium]|nr:neutral/alkaline non-lysosomal ceramidase N-terminal domain-containing protein [Anaeromyxobacteraceae bacterium]
MKKLLTALALSLLAVASAIALGSLRWRAPREPGPPRIERACRGQGPLQAGAAEVRLDLPAGVPLGGFPRLRWASEGVRDPVAARALVLAEPGCAVALVSVEILLVPGELSRAAAELARERAGIPLDEVVVVATHTHAGPGGYWRSVPGERFATGPYDAGLFRRLAERIAEAVARASASRQPASLLVSRADLPALARNRDGERVDGRLLALRAAAAGGRTIGEVLVFPAHSTILGSANRLVSGDWPGALSRSRPGVALVMQGAVGDQSVRLSQGAAADPEAYARALGERVDALAFPPGEASPRLAAAAAEVSLPDPDFGGAPPMLRRLAANALGGSAPSRSWVVALRAGPALLLFSPAEPVEAVGRAWRQAAGDGAEAVSLAGDYLGYVETPQRTKAGLGEAKRSYYGPSLAYRLGDALVLAAEATRAER